MKYPSAKRGRKYRSQLEGRVAKRLSGMKLAFEYETLLLPYVKEYKPDFILNKDTDKEIILEVKGVLTKDDRAKMVKVKRDHPERDIRFVFMHPHRKMMHSKSTHAKWAEKNGFPWYSETDFKKRDLT